MERILGFCFMGLAVYLLSLLPEERRIAALAALALLAPAVWIWGRSGASVRPALFKAATAVLCALALWIGLREPAPPAHWAAFNSQNFEAALGKKPLLLMFTADWCPNCKLLEHAVYTDERLREMRSRYGLELIRVDLTRENAPGTALLRALGSVSIPFAALFPTGPEASAPLVLRDMYSGTQLDEALARTFAPAP
jgi:thiol:disulfide interchange protein DsbD